MEIFADDAFPAERYANGGLLYETLRERLRYFERTTEEEESDAYGGLCLRSLGVFDIAFFFRPKSQRSDRLLQIFYSCTM
ncbi:MAG: hypothetical protein V7K77_31605 [Nostoc sp.]|uniref:hypothetical protein n=1 Tax=Nostoc sp. TaxID=1180 RepID=UPI002FFA829E